MAKLTWRIWLLIFMLILAALAILGFPPKILSEGALIKSVDKNSTASNSGLIPGLVIQAINGQPVKNKADYNSIINNLTFNKTKVEIKTDKGSFVFLADEPPEITVDEIPKTQLKTGLDLSGGARALVKPETHLNANEMNDLVATTSNRLNVFGISDVTVKPVTDLSGNNFMLIEIAGATPSDIKDLISQQGKFEAKIGDDTVFTGGKKDITFVCRNDASCSGIEACYDYEGIQLCRFRFVIDLSPEAAARHANITAGLGVNVTEQGRYLDKKLDLYLDDSLVDSLLIGEDLKGSATTQIQIQGSGTGATREAAIKSAQDSMKKLQTVLITGSLPYKLDIVKLDSISPALGKEFTKNIIYLGLFVFLAVSVALFVKYRKIKITSAVILTMFSEALITLGVAALIRWNLDAPSIAGIIAGMGTGVNDQIVIIDESVSNVQVSIKEKIKRALFVILGAFFTIIAAMLPLFWAGAGLLRGFALTTIIDVSIGILITRPAFADIMKKIVS